MISELGVRIEIFKFTIWENDTLSLFFNISIKETLIQMFIFEFPRIYQTIKKMGLRKSGHNNSAPSLSVEFQGCN